MSTSGSSAPFGDRTTKVVGILGACAVVVIGVVLAAGSTRQTLIDDEPVPTTVAAEVFTPSPQSGPVVELVPDSVGQPAPEPARDTADVAPTPTVAPDPASSARVDAALSRIAYDWRSMLPGWTLEFSSPRRGLMGLTTTTERRIEIYVRPSMSTDALAHVIAHEIGHAVDVTRLSGEDRVAFQLVRGRAAGDRWWADDAASDFATGAGDWAESFSYMVTGGRGPWRSQLGAPPGFAQQVVMRELMR